MLLLVVVCPAKCTVIHHGEEWKDNIRQKKEIGKGTGESWRGLAILEVVHVDDQAKHEHGCQNRPDDIQPGSLEPAHSKRDQHRANQQQNPGPDGMGNGEVSDPNESQSNPQQPQAVGKAQNSGHHGK